MLVCRYEKGSRDQMKEGQIMTECSVNCQILICEFISVILNHNLANELDLLLYRGPWLCY